MKTRGSGGDDDLTNLITLCRRHHDLAQVHIITIQELHSIMKELYGYHYG